MKTFSFKWVSFIFIIGFAIFLYGDVWGTDWKYFGKTSSGDCFYDVEGITRQPNGISRVWTKIIFSEQGRIGEVTAKGEKYKDLEVSKDLIELDCKGKRSNLISSIFYS
jgi:hypothetical protein